MKKKIIVLSGAGMSQESGIRTFRDADGLWEGHDVQEVAAPEGWQRNPARVLDFYNQRRRQLTTVQPNAGHLALVRLESRFEVQIITQNVDNLHERAGSANVLHLHGELTKVRSTGPRQSVYDWTDDLQLGDVCDQGFQLRPHIVWFGEELPQYQKAVELCRTGNIFIIIGTSMQVYPAAGLIGYADEDSPIYFVDPRPSLTWELQHYKKLDVWEGKAGEKVPDLVDQLLEIPC